MDTIETIMTRHSVRSYTDKTVPQEKLEIILKAAMAAPSAGNQQPWHFVIVDDKTILNEIPKYHAYSSMLRQAPVAIVVCANKQEEIYDGYWPQDCSAATENLLLAAHAEGLGAVWLGIHPIPERVSKTQKLLNMPNYVIPMAVIALGYPDQSYVNQNSRYNTEKIHNNKW